MAHNPVMNRNPYFKDPATPNRQSFDPTQYMQQSQYEAQGFGYEQPQFAPAERMSYDDAMVKTILLLAVTVISGTLAAMFTPLTLVNVVAVTTSLIALGVSFFAAMRPMVSPATAIAYAVLEGIALGSITGALNLFYPGIAFQAVLGTVAVVAVATGLHMSGAVRTSPKGRKIMLVVMGAAIIYSLVNMFLVLTGASTSFRGLDTAITIAGIPLGVILGIGMIVIAGYMLISDFEDARNAVANGAPKEFSWTVAFGIVATVMWIYIEVLRILSIFASDR